MRIGNDAVSRHNPPKHLAFRAYFGVKISAAKAAWLVRPCASRRAVFLRSRCDIPHPCLHALAPLSAERARRAPSTGGRPPNVGYMLDVDSIALGRDFRENPDESSGSCESLLALIGP